MAHSIFWYDFETTGTDPRRDRPLQVAGVRTDLELNEIEPPLNLHCRLSDDILPHPAACLVTGILPETLAREGLTEGAFLQRLHQELARPNTCTVGYNNLRFDDEMVRHGFYRNFLDPYAREWQGDNSRWDVLELIRATYAFRPETLNWPEEEGRVSLRLDRLTLANGIEHGQAHDALADVRATLALARLVKHRQPRLYDYLWRQRRKREVLRQIRLLEPLWHVSGRFAAERHFIAPVLPLAWHPVNRNALIVCDLAAAPGPLFELDAGALRERLYTRREALEPHQLPVPLKLVHVNRCPVLAPLAVLRAEDLERLQLDLASIWQGVRELTARAEEWRPKLSAVYAAEHERAGASAGDPELELYAGFIEARERQLCDAVRSCSAEELAEREWPFRDARLPELLFRYRARNFPQSLQKAELERWRQFCFDRLVTAQESSFCNFAQFEAIAEQLRLGATVAQQGILDAWLRHAQEVRARLQG